MYNIYDMLVFPALDGATEMRPHLAESIDIDETGTVYTIKLRPDVKFHSGNTMTADDVVFSMNRILALKKGYSFLFDGWVESAEAKDPLTAVITLTKPYGAFYSSLSRLGIVDSKTIMANKGEGPHGEFGDYGASWLLKNSAGTGAYKVVSHARHRAHGASQVRGLLPWPQPQGSGYRHFWLWPDRPGCADAVRAGQAGPRSAVDPTGDQGGALENRGGKPRAASRGSCSSSSC